MRSPDLYPMLPLCNFFSMLSMLGVEVERESNQNLFRFLDSYSAQLPSPASKVQNNVFFSYPSILDILMCYVKFVFANANILTHTEATEFNHYLLDFYLLCHVHNFLSKVSTHTLVILVWMH